MSKDIIIVNIYLKLGWKINVTFQMKGSKEENNRLSLEKWRMQGHKLNIAGAWFFQCFLKMLTQLIKAWILVNI